MAVLLYKDAPEWTHIILAYHEYEGPIRVELCTVAVDRGASSGLDFVTLYEYDDCTGEICGFASGPNRHATPLCQYFYQRTLMSPWVFDRMAPRLLFLVVLESTNGHRAVTLYAHPDHAHNLVREVMPPVPWEVKVVLVATKECKAAYNNNMDNRKAQAIWQTGIRDQVFDLAREECIASGFMTKRRVLTSRGRSIAGKTRLESLKR